MKSVEGLVFRLVFGAFFGFADLRKLDNTWVQSIGVGNAGDASALPLLLLNCLTATDADVVDR